MRFNADSAFTFVKAQCDFGARVPNSPAHDRCAAYIVAQFKRYGLQVQEQKTTLKGWDGKQLKCNNIIASYRPELKDRIVLCSHWDSRPWADADPDSSKHREPVMAANDGASGVAVLLEIARQIKEINPLIWDRFCLLRYRRLRRTLLGQAESRPERLVLRFALLGLKSAQGLQAALRHTLRYGRRK